MGDLAVRQPHLGRESIALLRRIVDSEADGVAQDDIEPYLLVRLLRCGYIRRQEPDAVAFVATPAGIERCELEAIAARRRQEEQDRREIIRGRLQATVARLERDYPAPPPPPTLADFALPTIHRRALRGVDEPAQPAPGVGGLRLGQDGRPVTRDDRPRMIRDDAPRPTPEDALSVIRESERRAIRERELPVIQADDLRLPGEDGRPVVHVGRLPEKRQAGVRVAREDAVPAVHADDVPAILLVPLVGDLSDPDAPTDDAPTDNDAAQFELSDEGGGWKRAAAMTAVAAVALMAGDPALRYLSPSIEVPPQAPTAQRPMLPTPKLATADAVIPQLAAEPSRQAAPVRSVADLVLPPAVGATGAAPAVAAAHDRAPVATRNAPESRRRPASESSVPATMTRVADAAPTGRADPAAATLVPPPSAPPISMATQPAEVPSAVEASGLLAMMASQALATDAVVALPTAGVSPSPAMTATPVVATQAVVASPALEAPPHPATAATQALATQPVVATPAVVPSRAVVAAPPIATIGPAVMAPSAVATPPEPMWARRKPDHAAAEAKDALLLASATVTAPAERREARAEPQPNAATRESDRLAADAHRDEVAVDRLNTLSLMAALQGKSFSPRAVLASVLSRRATSPRRVLPPSLP